MMKLRLRAWDRTNSAVTFPEHNAGRTMEASASQWVPDPPQPLLSQKRRQQPGHHHHLHASPSLPSQQ